MVALAVPPSGSLPYVRPYLYPKQYDALFHDKRYGFIEAPQPMSADVYTPTGPVKMGDLEIGDLALNEQGEPTPIVDITDYVGLETYEITLCDGSVTQAAGAHLWTLHHPTKGVRTVNTATVATWSETYLRQWRVPDPAVAHFEEQEVSIDPWLLGALLGDEHYHSIPDAYKYNTPQVRYAVLQGLTDTDGYVDIGGNLLIEQTSPQLADDIAEIVRSLGGIAKIHYYPARQDGWHDSYKVYIQHPDPTQLVSLPRKAERLQHHNYRKRNLRSVQPVGIQDCRCITIDGTSHLYLTDDMIPTHNSTKSGKGQPLSAVLHTPNGPTTMGEIQVGDIIAGPDNEWTTVTGIYPLGEQDIYTVTFQDGTEVQCTEDHLWNVQTARANPQTITLKELLDYTDWKLPRTWVPNQGVTPYLPKNVPIPPYALGLLLGDGGMTGQTLKFSSADPELVHALRWELMGWANVTHDRNYDYRITRDTSKHWSIHPVIQALRDLGLWGCYSQGKFIPDIYKYNSAEVRMAILQGLLDTDGWVGPDGQPHFDQTSERLADDVTEIVQSLGGHTLRGFKDNDYSGCYLLKIVHPDAPSLFRLPRKQQKTKPKTKPTLRKFRSIELTGHEPAQCIKVSRPDGLYLTNGHITTHNTAGALAWIIEQALINGGPNRNFWWIAPGGGQADIAFRRARQQLSSKTIYKALISRANMTFVNGAILWFKSGDNPDGLYGEDVYAAVIDEASRVKEETWWAIRSTLTFTRGPVRCIGNVQGRKNWFYKAARLAEQGETESHFARITAYDAIEAGVLDPEEIEDAKRTYPEIIFKELYLAQAADDANNPFGLDNIDKCIGEMSTNPAVVYGVDLGRKQDWTVVVGLDKNGKVCHFDRWQHIPWRTTVLRIISIIGRTPTLVDASGVGDSVVEDIKREGIEQNLKLRVRGFVFTGSSQPALYERLIIAIQAGRITYPDNEIVRELRSFEFVETSWGYSYGAETGMFDDCVAALALAWRAWLQTKSRRAFRPVV